MTSFVLIPGAGGSAWSWHRVVPLLHEAGHEAIAVDLPGDDETAGLPEYTSLVTGAIGDRDDVVLVAVARRVHRPAGRGAARRPRPCLRQRNDPGAG
jgi:hypothetical protein